MDKKLRMWTVLSILAMLEKAAKGECPLSQPRTHVYRLGDSRYYIHHNPTTRKESMNWDTAKALCEKEKDFKMATIETLTAFTYVARMLEEWVNAHEVQDTWYWLDAKFDEKLEMYTWSGDSNRALRFTNYFYRYPRPTGVGSQVNWRNEYELNSNVPQCLALALPLPGLATTTKMPGGMIFGHAASFDERPCTSMKKRHAICEYIPGCGANIGNDPFTLMENKESYFEEGNWIVGNRLYVINWKPRSQKESNDYCEKRGMKLMNPTLNEQCLIPHLKMWSRAVTLSQFWTEWTYKVEKGNVGKFYDASGTEKATWRAFSNTTGIAEYQEEIDGRSNKFNKTFCVTLQLSYEFKNTQIPCPEEELKACNWNFIQYVPSNCNNYQGTICQHKDNVKRRCDWSGTWIKNPNEFLKDGMESTVEFGFYTNEKARRSRYKQTFGSLVCPKGYKMARHDSTRWYTKPTDPSTIIYLYDYQESYWVVDEGEFNKDVTSQCTTSEPDGDDGFSRKNRKVSCTDWHFYVCEKRVKPVQALSVTLPYEIPQATGWNEERHARIYPIL